MRTLIALAACAALMGCGGGGLSDSSSCGEWLDATGADRGDYVDGADIGAFPENFRGLINATCEVDESSSLGAIRSAYLDSQ